MGFKEDVKQFSERASLIKDTIATEEATKMSLILPMFQLLGYDVFNPTEFCPEFNADVGIKKGEKVDYAILVNGEATILIEAKAVNKKLDKYSSQLFRYFISTKARFGILTNGISYKFYTDLDETNKMDKEPFLEIDLLNIQDAQISQLEKFSKSRLNVSEILDTASLLKYTTFFKNKFMTQLKEPSDDFVKFFIQSAYKGPKTQSVLEKFRPVLQKALNDFINETVNDKIQQALGTTVPQQPIESTPILNDADWDATTIIKEILNNTVDVRKISKKYTESYIAILYENNVRKWICRLILSSQKYIIFPSEGDGKKERKYPLNDMEDINLYKNELIDIASRFVTKLPAPEEEKKEYVYTRWGRYECPTPYKIDLTRGPRDYLES